MGVRATHRVKDSNNKTIGFIVNGNYMSVRKIKSNIELIDNLKVTSNGIIKSAHGKIIEISKKQYNMTVYKDIVNNNSISRDIQLDFNAWRQKYSKLVLCVEGARQIGKTTEVMKFAYKNYEQVVYINLANSLEKDFLENNIDNTILITFVKYCIKFELDEFVDDKKTVIIIDEIQESTIIYNTIRAMQQQLHCDVIISGSYLGKTLNSEYFKPAGNIHTVEMLPLSFTEFTRIFKKDTSLRTISLYGESDDAEYNELTNLYKIYRQIGGYPSVVSTYIATKNIPECMKILSELIKTFTDESARYFQDTKCKVIFENVYKTAMIEMTKEKKGTSSKDIRNITSFVKDSTDEHVSRNEVSRAISWLKYSKIIGSCDLYENGDVSKLLNERRIYFMDCGILNCIAKSTSLDNSSIDGILTENFAYTELYRLYKTDKVKGDKPCCSTFNNYELDFFIVDKNDNKIGLEIKTSMADAKSLNYYLQVKKIDYGYIAGVTRGGIGSTIRKIPIYTVGCRFPY